MVGGRGGTNGRPERTEEGTMATPSGKRVQARFFAADSGNEPVRDWLRELPVEDRRAIGRDIKTAEFGWPVGMPVCRPLRGDVWEIRTPLSGNRIARVLFAVEDGNLVLLHGFMKKARRTPTEAIRLAERRLRTYRA